jgi:hypothetical protein
MFKISIPRLQHPRHESRKKNNGQMNKSANACSQEVNSKFICLSVNSLNIFMETATIYGRLISTVH